MCAKKKEKRKKKKGIARLPSEMIFAILPSSSSSSPPSSPSSDELVETSLCNEFGNHWPLLIRAALRYSDEACLCVTDLRRGTTLSKGTLSILYSQNACRFSISTLFYFTTFISYVSHAKESEEAKWYDESKWSHNNNNCKDPHLKSSLESSACLKTRNIYEHPIPILSQLYIIHTCY